MINKLITKLSEIMKLKFEIIMKMEIRTFIGNFKYNTVFDFHVINSTKFTEYEIHIIIKGLTT